MNSTLFTGIAMICAGKLQQAAGWIIGSRKHQILGFDQELRGRATVAGAGSQRTPHQLVPVRVQRRRNRSRD